MHNLLQRKERIREGLPLYILNQRLCGRGDILVLRNGPIHAKTHLY